MAVGAALTVVLVSAFIGVPILLLTWPAWKRSYDMVRGEGRLGWWQIISYWMAIMATAGIFATFLFVAWNELDAAWEVAVVIAVTAWIAFMIYASWMLWLDRPPIPPSRGPVLTSVALTPLVMFGAAATLSLWFIPVGVPILAVAFRPWRRAVRSVDGADSIDKWTLVATLVIASASVGLGVAGLWLGADDLTEGVETAPAVLVGLWVALITTAAAVLVRDRHSSSSSGTNPVTQT